MSFIYDNGVLNYPKSDLRPIGSGDPTKFFQALDWNGICQALVDTRSALLHASFFGLDPVAADPAPSGINAWLWAKTDGSLHWHGSGGDVALVLGTRQVIAGTGLSGGGALSANVTLALATFGTAGTYTSVTTDAYGRVASGTNPSVYQTVNNPAGTAITQRSVLAFTSTFSVMDSASRTLVELATTGVGAGTYNSVTVNSFGQVTAGTNTVDTDYYQTIQLPAGTAKPQRSALAFSSNFAHTDNSGQDRSELDLSSTGVSAGTYTSVTVDAKGRVSAGTNPVTSSTGMGPLSIAAGSRQSHDKDTPKLIVHGFSFDKSRYTGYGSIKFRAVAAKGLTINGTVELFNVTDNATVTGSVLSFSSTSLALAESADIQANLPASAKIYEVRIYLASAGGVGDTVELYSASLEIIP